MTEARKTYDTTPTPEFCEAYRSLYGRDPTPRDLCGDPDETLVRVRATQEVMRRNRDRMDSSELFAGINALAERLRLRVVCNAPGPGYAIMDHDSVLMRTDDLGQTLQRLTEMAEDTDSTDDD